MSFKGTHSNERRYFRVFEFPTSQLTTDESTSDITFAHETPGQPRSSVLVHAPMSQQLRIRIATDDGGTNMLTIREIWGLRSPDDVTPVDPGDPPDPTIPTPTGVAGTSARLECDDTVDAYYTTFQHDDNADFTSPTNVHDFVESTMHFINWTPPSGTTYIRARFTTAVNDGGDHGNWSSTETYIS